MKRSLLGFLAFILLGLLLSTFTGGDERPAPLRLISQPIGTTETPASSSSPILYGPYRVVRVVDGDTLVVDIDDADVKIRLIGIDTPETVDPRKPVQCYGEAASDKAKALLTDQRVRLEYDESQGAPSAAEASEGTVDKYGRTLAYVYLPDGTLFNQYMIEAGYAHEYTYAAPYRYQATFRAAEASAREAKRGLWADDACS